MAHMKYSDKEGHIIELDVKIYDPEEEVKTSDYSVSNGLIVQNIEIDMTIGEHEVIFPISYTNENRGVFISKIPEEAKQYVFITDYDKTKCTVKISPHSLDPNTKVALTTTGY